MEKNEEIFRFFFQSDGKRILAERFVGVPRNGFKIRQIKN
ncbi:hypothetical protein LEP1GSC072_1081 [Leptospira noguchii str. Bonito]|nr:hypothetical protein LEP1GSC072_1081 [Leptospira noguchii str. Bonito]